MNLKFNPNKSLESSQSLPLCRGKVRMEVELWNGSVSTPSLALHASIRHFSANAGGEAKYWLPLSGGGNISANKQTGFNAGLTLAYQPCFTKQACSKQQGMVLFFALIALVVMSLAAVALIRSVDTNTLIAGNLGSKVSATISSDSGLETAMDWLEAANQAALNNDNSANGYYARDFDVDGNNVINNDDAKALVDQSSTKATGVDVVSGRDSSGNTTTYVIQRMCRDAGPATPGNCLFGPPPDPQDSKRQCDPACPPTTGGSSLMYRVTIKVAGPKNTVSYTQAFVY